MRAGTPPQPLRDHPGEGRRARAARHPRPRDVRAPLLRRGRLARRVRAAGALPGAERLDYNGGSFGGGIGALALPWDDRFTRAHLYVPSFGHHPLRLAAPSTGSGEAVRRLLAREPHLRPVLDYFDAAIAARRIHIPVYVSAARRDPAVLPDGQFAVYEALAGPKHLYVLSTGHPANPAELSARDRDLAHFFAH
ncbi:acetylxylan esterase [Phytohabitans rumicis]|uniref:Acetyl xylan esterase domain-containing protein n=1 Tax=Phytohabitans rumicis TaxID=1076125 RepID=A0A6V8L4E8_9ACTN|nr:acetylxylan esterase [Phytohabitans rumicis]GFJ88937.1 hypothetical protein Prum_025790 [Phytohabitans rumicis]